MTDRLGIALAQLNPTVGDIAGNTALLRRARARAATLGADLVIASELVITGYPPEDLVLKPAFQERAEAAVRELAAETGDGGPALVVGMPWRQEGKLYNASALLADGEVAAVRLKRELPNYSVFDEKRVFARGPLPGPVDFCGCRLGLMVCEDLWTAEVPECLQESGADILIVINGSPFERDKHDRRINMAVSRVVECGLPLIYVNQTGGQDELVFDGASFALNADRTLAAQLPAWREAVTLSNWVRDGHGPWACAPGECAEPVPALESIYLAMVTGLGDYVRKNGFPGVVLGLSGGVDSALSAAVAVDALGADKVHALMMPSRFTSDASIEDAAACAEVLGIAVTTIGIEPAVEAYGEMMAGVFEGRAPEIVPRLALRGELFLDDVLRGDARVVGAGQPQHVKPAHTLPAGHDVWQRLVQGVAYVQRAGDVGWRQHHAEPRPARCGGCAERAQGFPVGVPLGIDRGVIKSGGKRAHCRPIVSGASARQVRQRVAGTTSRRS